jgi:uncharacterized metal-binding protein YceD (DUF177 family)
MGKSQYKIQFGGLSFGEHQFEFEVNDKFFEQFSESEITSANVLVKANLVKQNTIMHVLFTFEGFVKLSCDRCLVDYNCPVSGNEKLIVKHGNPDESTDEMIVLKEGLEEIDFTQYLYEYIELALPYRRVPCEDEELDIEVECDKETLAKFNELKIEEEKTETDPKWDKLKNIKFNNN